MYIQLDDGIVFSIVYQTINYWSNFVSGETIVKTVTKSETYSVALHQQPNVIQQLGKYGLLCPPTCFEA